MNTSEPIAFQVHLFDRIFKQSKGKKEIFAELGEILSCSRSSLFRKRSGDTPLTTEELFKLADHYHYSIDEMRSGTDGAHILFKSQSRITNYVDLEIYLSQTLGNLAISQMVPDSHLYYIARDLPLFQYFADPLLGAFKSFVWIEETAKTKSPFKPQDIPKSLLEKGKQLYDLYFQMPTSEIWSVHTINNIIDQITHYRNSKRIAKEDVNGLFNSLGHVITQTEQRAANQVKTTGKSFQLYWCPFIMGANTGLLAVKDTVISYIGYSAINYLMSSHSSVGDNVKSAFYYQTEEGINITGLAEEKRNEFFSLLRQKIENAK